MRKWTRDRSRRRNKGQKPANSQNQPAQQAEAPLQPTFLDRATADWSGGEPGSASYAPEPVIESQPEAEAGEAPQAEAAAQPGRRGRSRRRGGRGRRGRGQQARPSIGIAPGLATGEAAEVEGAVPGEELDAAARPHAAPKTAPAVPKGAVVLAIGLPGSGKSSWFKRHNVVPLSSDLIRGLLFDDPTEQRYQELVFSTLRSLLRARLLAGRPMNYIDATNLSPKERHNWIRMARDFGYEAHAVFFDVPLEVCMERNRTRSRNVPDDVMTRMSHKLRPPRFEEGFAKVTVVRLKATPAGGETPTAEAED